MKDGAAILVVDDEQGTVDSIIRTLEPEGYRVQGVNSAEDALDLLRREVFDVVLCDIRLDGADGLALQRQIRAAYPDVPVVMITAYAAVETAVRALKEGAYDYIAKPFSGEELRVAVRRALESRRLSLENDSLRTVVRHHQDEHWTGQSACMRRLYEEAAKVAASHATVFISGESGTGKELLARYLHATSPRSEAVFVAVNCAAFPGTLADSQLFGHVRGAFTGAVADQRGLLEVAQGGTLFLDELAELQPEVQAKLLRTLEDHRLRRLGSEREIEVHVRILAAARQEPEKLVEAGRLRDDLFYRLGGIHLRVPPLRERTGDIAGLALHFLRRLADELKKPIAGITPEAVAALERYPWPGNVRELKNVLERAAIFVAAGQRVDLSELSEKLREGTGGERFVIESTQPLPLREVSDRYIQHVLARCGGKQAEAARWLDVAPSTLWRRQGTK